MYCEDARTSNGVMQATQEKCRALVALFRAPNWYIHTQAHARTRARARARTHTHTHTHTHTYTQRMHAHANVNAHRPADKQITETDRQTKTWPLHNLTSLLHIL